MDVALKTFDLLGLQRKIMLVLLNETGVGLLVLTEVTLKILDLLLMKG